MNFDPLERDRPPRQEGFKEETEEIFELIQTERGDQRIGQFLINAIATYMGVWKREDIELALWDIEDDELLEAIKKLK